LFIVQVKLEDKLGSVLIEVQKTLLYIAQRKELLTQYYEHWKVFVSAGRDFNTQWKQFVVEARKVGQRRHLRMYCSVVYLRLFVYS